MSTPIAQFPRGLLGVFDIKSAGEYPKQLTRDIGLQFDISQLQLQGNASFQFDNTLALNGAGTVGGGAYVFTTALLVAVPSNEVWVVTAASVMLDILGAGALASPPAIGFNYPGVTGVSGFVPLSNAGFVFGIQESGAATRRYVHGPQQLSSPIVLPPGAVLVYLNPEDATGVAGGEIRYRSHMRFLRARV